MGVVSLSSCHGFVFSLVLVLFIELTTYGLLVLYPSFVVIEGRGFMLVLALLSLLCGIFPGSVCLRWRCALSVLVVDFCVVGVVRCIGALLKCGLVIALGVAALLSMALHAATRPVLTVWAGKSWGAMCISWLASWERKRQVTWVITYSIWLVVASFRVRFRNTIPSSLTWSLLASTSHLVFYTRLCVVIQTLMVTHLPIIQRDFFGMILSFALLGAFKQISL